MNLSDLQNKEIIDIASGRRIGLIIDVIISINGTVQKLILEDKKNTRRFLATSKDEITIEWNQIIKIGDDIILVDSKNDLDYYS